jgi:hypothetical protein
MVVALVLAFGVGGIAAWLAKPGGKPDDTSIAYGPVERGDSATRERTEYERQIADLRKELAAAQLQRNSGDTSMPPQVSLEQRKQKREHANRVAAWAQGEIEADKLMAAGFSRERIEWIGKRKEELYQQYQQKGASRQPDEVAAHFYDRDIGLRQELGDDEYTRYRQALGRGVGLKVSEVLPGGSGQAAGLKAGDEIVSYGGIRVFNTGELNPLIRRYEASGGAQPVEVIRNGQRILLNAPAGDLVMRQKDPHVATHSEEGMRAQVNDLVKKMAEISQKQ